MNTTPRTVALYWHNGRSLGHTSRIAKVARYLLRSTAAYSVAGITGAYRGLDLLPTDMDIIKIPSFANFDDPTGWNLRPRLALDSDQLTRVRTDLITTFLKHYHPEVLVSDHIPRGTDDELVPALEAGYARHAVLGLRGILFDRDKTFRKYFGPGRGPWILDHYCQFHVHTHPEVFDLADYYGICGEAADRLHYTGYLSEPCPLTRAQARERIGVPPDERLVVVAMGGGQGAGPLWKSLSEALSAHRTMFDRALLVPGPYLEPVDHRALTSRWADDPRVEVRSYEPDLSPWMRACDLFIGAGGVNMLGEILATRANSLVVPRQVREIEQRVHTDRLESFGLVRRVDLPDALDGALIQHVAQALAEPLAPEATRYLWDGGSYDRHLPGPNGTACACTTRPSSSRTQA